MRASWTKDDLHSDDFLNNVIYFSHTNVIIEQLSFNLLMQLQS